jgi:selenocysteine lyase/cysteine desulfurase
MLILGEGITDYTLTEGGSGVHSLDAEMPFEPPERYEAGTLPTPAIVGLCEGIKLLERIGLETVWAHECELYRYLRLRLSETYGVRIYAAHHEGSVLLFNLNGLTADTVGRELDRREICVRSGYHCAALAHKSLRTPIGGAVRVGLGAWTRKDEIDVLVDALREISRSIL